LFALAGIPPLAGFMGKFWILMAALHNDLLWLAIVLVIFSGIALWYYLSVMVQLWFKPIQKRSVVRLAPEETHSGLRVLIFLGLILLVTIGIMGPRYATKLQFAQASSHHSALRQHP